MKKGFTLVELLAVIVILGFVAVLTVPAVSESIRYAGEKAYEANIESIKNAANDWALLNTRLLPKEGGSILIYLQELKDSKNIDRNIKNPKTGKYLSNNTSVTISKIDGKYTFDVNVVEIDTKDNSNALALLIGGNIIDYFEVNQDGNTYTIPEATARTSSGVVSDAVITYQIFKNNQPVSLIDTSSIGEYKIIYTVTYEGTSGNYEKQVHIIDTTKPVMDIGDSIVCSVGNIPSDFLAGVTVSDNSGEEIIPTVDSSNVKNVKGIYYVYYTATDSSGNSLTERKEVIVNE